ncbi:tyrosine-type recombinase/integrase [Bosea sp. UC22_33]|uniref:tyrosine-type recombinase/integrase n=1 Tax=Bosea sp. UC22_33 TaxID=3350165 RepID=UPI00366D4419
MALEKLSALKVAKLSRVGLHSDGQGLGLQISRWSTKSWIFRYSRGGKEHRVGLGPYPDVSLAEARLLAQECRRQLRAGLDPLSERRAKLATVLADATKSVSFSECSTRYISAHEASWRNEKHRQQWKNSLATYADPVIGKLDVKDIDTGLVLRILEPIWSKKTETATRLRGRIEQVLDWAKVRGYRTSENPARWKGHLDKLLASPKKIQKIEHHAAVAIDDAPAVVKRLRALTSSSARCLEFVILTASRSGEALGAVWDEFDFAGKVWRIPGSRMKAHRDHAIPLTADMLKLLEGLPREKGNPFVFIGAKAGSGLSNMSLLMLLRGMMPDQKVTTHGFRSTFKDWASERTSFANEVSEAALAHTIENKAEAAYRRGDLLEKRRRLMAAWGAFLSSEPKAGQGAKVVAIRAK